jgi:type I restriction enzyme S subunit
MKTKKNVLLEYASGSTFLEISPKNLKSIQIPLPPLPEQEAIAEVLSDTDTLITALEKRIAKKRNMKQGSMQKLLSPKDDWEVKKLGKIAEIRKGSALSKNKLSDNGKYSCLLYGELFTTYKEVINRVVSKTNYEEGIKSKYGDILFPGSTTTSGIDLAKASALLFKNILLGGDIIIVRNQIGYNSEFVSYFLNQINRNEIAKKTKGITIHHLYGNDLKDIEIALPSKPEQIRIATILSDMDSEIDALEKKLSKTKELKQGLMQQLLTGKIRLA